MDVAKDASPGASPKSHSTSLTTPDQSPGNDDAIWASDSDHAESNNDMSHRRPEMLSDLPTIRRQHMTDGYREGLAIGKAKVMQQGFDDGYPIGITIALRAGKIIGILEGYVASKGIVEDKTLSSRVQKVLDQAREELACGALLKAMNDESIASAKDVPDDIERTLQRWEHSVLGK